MSVRDVRTAAVAATVLLVCTPDVGADIGLPMVVLYLPPAWLCFLPIVIIEAVVGVVRFKVARRRALVAQTVANAVSTGVGLPITWIVLATGELACCGTAPGLGSFGARLYAVTVQAPWLIPYEDDLDWMVPVAVLVLTVPFYWMSVACEYPILRRFFPELPRPAVWAWTIRGNILTYAFLLGVILLQLHFPGLLEWAFDPFTPITRALYGVVYWLIRHQPLPF